MDKPIKISVFDHESDGKHVLMGAVESTVNGLVKLAASQGSLTLKVKGKETGTVVITKASVSGIQQITDKLASTSISPNAGAVFSPPPTTSFGAALSAPPPSRGASFIDYVSGGCELNVSVAIDFTGSNGKCVSRWSLLNDS